MVEAKNKLIYVGDPMCSWCWGIADELQQLRDHYSGKLEFELVLGGLRPGGGEEWNDRFKDFLRGHWEHVEAASGQEFNYSLLELNHFNYDTEPPSRAVVIARQYLDNDNFLFFKDVQKRFYSDNADPNKLNFYEEICEKYDIPFEEFKAKMADESIKKLTYVDFAIAQKYGVRGFPSVLIQKDGTLQYITRGYSTFGQMKERIDTVQTENNY
jgi:putative protein-disulfide isomerase